ncbi:unnamed protein product, partial [Cuscuta epithymum]
MTKIGVGEQLGGLFYLAMGEPVRINKAASLDSRSLWHARLGHPSPQVMDLLPQISDQLQHDQHSAPCDICHRAKQTRSNFSLSTSRADDVFDLIHCDIWGPYSAN